MEKGQTWLTLKWAMIYNRGVWFYNLEDKIFSLPFWILNHNFFVLLYLGCSCRTGVCILSSTESTNSTNHTSNQQARNFTSVANSMFENLEGNFKNKTKKYVQNDPKLSFRTKKKILHQWDWRLSGGFPEGRFLLFSPAEHMGVWPLAAVHTSTKWFVQNSNSLGSIVGAWSGHTACNCLVF